MQDEPHSFVHAFWVPCAVVDLMYSLFCLPILFKYTCGHVLGKYSLSCGHVLLKCSMSHVSVLCLCLAEIGLA